MPYQTNGYYYDPMPRTSYTTPYNPYSSIPVTNSNTFVWVQGEQAAKSYPVAPGNQVLLFDSEDSVFYIKKTDQTGRPLPLEIYDFKKRESVETLPDASITYVDFATKEDVRNIIKEELESFKSSQFKPRNKEEKK